VLAAPRDIESPPSGVNGELLPMATVSSINSSVNAGLPKLDAVLEWIKSMQTKADSN